MSEHALDTIAEHDEDTGIQEHIWGWWLSRGTPAHVKHHIFQAGRELRYHDAFVAGRTLESIREEVEKEVGSNA